MIKEIVAYKIIIEELRDTKDSDGVLLKRAEEVKKALMNMINEIEVVITENASVAAS